MASFSTSGNLSFKPLANNFMSKLKRPRSLWFVIFEEYAMILGFKTKTEFDAIQVTPEKVDYRKRGKSLDQTDENILHKWISNAVEYMDLTEATINLSKDSPNEFVLLNKDKEWVLSAESQEAVLHWIMGIQESRQRKSKDSDQKKPNVNPEVHSIDSDATSSKSGQNMRKFSHNSTFSWSNDTADIHDYECEIILEEATEEYGHIMNLNSDLVQMSENIESAKMKPIELEILIASLTQMRNREKILFDLDEKIENLFTNEEEKNRVKVLTRALDVMRDEIQASVERKKLDDIQLNKMRMALKTERNNSKRWKAKMVQNFLKKFCYFTIYTNLKENAGIHVDGGDFDDYRIFIKIIREELEMISCLIEEERLFNPQLPSLNGSLNQYHIDEFGFKHLVGPTVKYSVYACRSLYRFLTEKDNTAVLMECLATVDPPNPILFKKPEWKKLFRSGFDNQKRSEIWWALIQKRLEYKFTDINPLNYYKGLIQKLANRQVMEQHSKQIDLDLLRTLPSHLNFQNFSSSGIVSLQEVLRCYSIHNPDVGYCQGMNFVAAISLIYLSRPESFWFMVIIVEKCLPKSFYNNHLVGVQAEQYILNELIAEKLPDLFRHLREYNIDISTITMTWFISLFHDSVPFETLIRIWDLFLLEGDKVLFRFALGILKLSQSELLQQKEPLTVWKTLKNFTKFTVNADDLINVAYNGFKPFPKRAELEQKYKFYLDRINEKYKENIETPPKLNPVIEIKTIFLVSYQCPFTSSIWLAYLLESESQLIKLALDERVILPVNFKTSMIIHAMASLEDGNMLFGGRDGELVLVNMEQNDIIWNYSTNSECITDIKVFYIDAYEPIQDLLSLNYGNYSQNHGIFERCIISLFTGELLIIDNIANKETSESISTLFVSHFPIKEMIVVDKTKELLCLAGSEIYILDYVSLDILRKVSTSDQPINVIQSLLLLDSEEEIFLWLFNNNELTLKSFQLSDNTRKGNINLLKQIEILNSEEAFSPNLLQIHAMDLLELGPDKTYLLLSIDRGPILAYQIIEEKNGISRWSMEQISLKFLQKFPEQSQNSKISVRIFDHKEGKILLTIRDDGKTLKIHQWEMSQEEKFYSQELNLKGNS